MTDSSRVATESSLAEQTVLCSSCYDNAEWAKRILAIIPQSRCAICEKRCLGYQTEKEPE